MSLFLRSCMCWGKSCSVCTITSGAIKISLCVCFQRGVCVIYTPPYCPISSRLSTHNNCQYPARYEAENKDDEEQRSVGYYRWV